MSRLGPCPLCDDEGPWANAAARAAHIRAHHTTDCDLCGQPVNASGLDAHMRYMHADETAPEPDAAQPAAPMTTEDVAESVEGAEVSDEPVADAPDDDATWTPDQSWDGPEPAAPDDPPPAPKRAGLLQPSGHLAGIPSTIHPEPEQVEDPAPAPAGAFHPGDEPRVTEPEQVEGPSPAPDLTCPDCGGGPYADRRGLAGHRRSHTEVTCDECGKKVKANGLGPHQRSHRKAEVVECPDCGTMVGATGLGNHRAGHRRATERAASIPDTPQPAAETPTVPRVDRNAEVDCPDCGDLIQGRGLGRHRAYHRQAAERAAAAAQAPRPPLAEVLTAMLPGAARELVDRVVEFIEQAREKPARGLWVVAPLNGSRPWLCRSAVVGHTAAREHAAALVVPLDDIYAAAQPARPGEHQHVPRRPVLAPPEGQGVVNGHHPTVTTTSDGAYATCSCGWQSPVRRVLHGWAAGAVQVARAYARAAHTAHALEEIAHAS